MHNKVDIEELYKQKDVIYEKYKQDKPLYRNEYDKICKKIRYWTNDEFRLNKNIKDNERNTIKKYGTEEYRAYIRNYQKDYRIRCRNQILDVITVF